VAEEVDLRGEEVADRWEVGGLRSWVVEEVLETLEEVVWVMTVRSDRGSGVLKRSYSQIHLRLSPSCAKDEP
jgi:hypothetical protein